MAQEYLLNYDVLTPEEGLANYNTSALYLDGKGFLWIGTSYGLNRYDGKDFELFTSERHNIHDDQYYFCAINEDDEENLWLFQESGEHREATRDFRNYAKAIDIFNVDQQKAVGIAAYFGDRLPFKVEDVVIPKINDPTNSIWITTLRGELFLYENQQFNKVYQLQEDVMDAISVDSRGYIWIGSKNRLLQLDSATGTVLLETSFEDDVLEIFCTPDGGVSVVTSFELATERNYYIRRVYQLQQDQTFTDLPLRLQEPSSNQRILSVYQTQSGFWLANIGWQIYVFDQNGQALTRPEALKELRIGSKFDYVQEIGDKTWFSTGAGLCSFQFQKAPFHFIPTDIVREYRGILEDSLGNIYLSNGHLFQFEPSTKVVNNLGWLNGTHCLIHKDDTFWGGYYDYNILLVGKNIKTGDPQYLKNSTGKGIAICHLPLDNGLDLIGTSQGIIIVDFEQETTTGLSVPVAFQKLQESEVNHIFRNEQGIWCVTSSGLFLLDNNLKVIRSFNKEKGDLPFNNLRYVAVDQRGIYWIATKGGGLIKWLPDFENNTSSVEQYTTQDGLSHDYLYAVLLDNHQNLWIPSDRGLMYFDVATSNIRTFLKEDGLPHNEFNLTAYHQSKDGTIYLGTLGGYFYFHPKDLVGNLTYSAPLRIKKINILEGKQENMSDYTAAFLEENKIIIRPNYKLLELNFSLLDFNRKEEKRYRYIIDGYAQSWETLQKGTIRINRLPFGKYTLRIQGQNINKGWSTEELAIPLVVLRPFYLQWWFFVALASLLAFGIYRFIQIREARLWLEKSKLESIIQQRTAKIQKDKEVIEEQAEELKILNATQRRFFANITHEFRTPLTLVIGPLQQLLKEHLPRKVEQQHKMMLKNAQQLQILINQLLDLVKLENGQMKIETAQGDLVAFTKDLVDTFQSTALSKNQVLTFQTSESAVNTNFDKEKWNKIVYNLVSNAIKFTPNKGKIKISLAKLPTEQNSNIEQISLVVQDTGVGIHQKDINSIFRRFYQVDGSTKRTQEGSGIGLSLVKELVELQGGEIKVKSEVGKGTSFEVKLPLRSESLALGASALHKHITIPPLSIFPEEIEPVTSQYATPQEGRQLELLIVEDNKDMQQYILNCLQPFDYKITVANDGLEAIKKALEIIPDLIISDIMMPHKDGYEVTTEIRQNVATSHIPIVLLTAKASLESRLEGLARGADAYLTKPFNPEELVMRVRKLIELRQLIQHCYQNGMDTAIIQSNTLPDLTMEDEFIKKLQNLVIENLTNPDLNGDWLAKEFHMGRTKFYKKIKALTNYSVGKYINIIRLQEAKKYVLTQDISLSEAAYRVGFSSPSHFSKVCKRITGKSPRELTSK